MFKIWRRCLRKCNSGPVSRWVLGKKEKGKHSHVALLTICHGCWVILTGQPGLRESDHLATLNLSGINNEVLGSLLQVIKNKDIKHSHLNIPRAWQVAVWGLSPLVFRWRN
jgi:hypothetical protein